MAHIWQPLCPVWVGDRSPSRNLPEPHTCWASLRKVSRVLGMGCCPQVRTQELAEVALADLLELEQDSGTRVGWEQDFLTQPC